MMMTWALWSQFIARLGTSTLNRLSCLELDELVKNVTPISQQYTFDFDLNITWVEQSSYGGISTRAENPHYSGIAYNNPILSPCLEIHPELMGINEEGEEGPNNDGHCHHDDEDFSDPDLDEVSEDIDDEGAKMYTSFNREPKSWLGYTKWLWAHMLSIDPDAALASEFPEDFNIISAHRLATNSKLEELSVGQQFLNKEDYIFAIKRYNIKVSINYKFTKYTPTLHVWECWRSRERCNWGVITHISHALITCLLKVLLLSSHSSG